MKIVYLFGAGASASINDKVPIMANFFKKTVEMLDKDNPRWWRAFAAIEEARALPHNPTIENLGIEMGVLGRSLQSLGESEASIKEKFTKSINNYKEAFMADDGRKSANLEDVFSRLESYKEKNPAACKDVYVRLQFLLAALFNHLDKELESDFIKGTHHNLSEYVANNNDKFEHIFISFNYDLWLEKALFQKKIWQPRDGHGTYCFEYYSQPLEDNVIPITGEAGVGEFRELKKFSAKQTSRVKVLKPHGSLSWRFGRKEAENDSLSWSAGRKEAENGLVILEKDNENACVAYNNTWYFPPTKFPKDLELVLEPLIIPPTPVKIRSHPLFWDTDKDVFRAISEADVIVTIGWSMPETDQYFKDIVSRALNDRKEQIKKMIICDKRQNTLLYSKFESCFRPKKIYVWKQGFNKNFVDFLKNELEHI